MATSSRSRPSRVARTPRSLRRAVVRAAAALVALALAVWLADALSLAGLLAPATAAPVHPVSALAFAPGARVPRARHVFLIIMENRSASAILHGTDDPYLRSLARRYVTATAYDATAHPSLPNYLALFAGSTFGIRSDYAPPTLRARNLVDALAAARRSFGAYMEGLPAPGWLGALYLPGLYAGRHDPFRYFTDIRRSAARRGRIQPLSALWPALRDGRAPSLVWITPNLCHDMHSCPTLTGDAWLRLVVPRILASSAWRRGGILFIVWDEGVGTSPGGPGRGGRVALYVIAPGLRPGARLTAPSDHYGLLHTIEAALGARCVGQSCAAPTLDLRSVAEAAAAAGA